MKTLTLIGFFLLSAFCCRSQSLIVSIPVVVHVVWHSAAENVPDQVIFDQLEELNKGFAGTVSGVDQVPAPFRNSVANTGIRFCLFEIVRVHTGRIRVGADTALFYSAVGGSEIRNPARFLNVYVADLGTALAGFAIYPDAASPHRDGIVIDPDYFGKAPGQSESHGRTLIHETGHYLGLYHLWKDDNDCGTDDGIEDTPPQQGPYFGCPGYPQYSCGGSNQFMNFMDYTNDNCLKMFTAGQGRAMLEVLRTIRTGLSHPNECMPYRSTNYFISPNPVQSIVLINAKDKAFCEANLRITDLTGRVMLHRKIAFVSAYELDVSNLTNGLYFLNLDREVIRFVKY